MKKILLFIIFFISLFVNSHVLASSISLSPSELKLAIGDSSSIKVIDEDNVTGVITWSSSNPSVASVNNGIVTANSLGKTTITASSNNYRAVCQIEVINNYISISEISLVNSINNLLVNESKQLEVKISPENASNKLLIYSSSDSSVASISQNGLITGKKVGQTYITVSAPVSNQKIVFNLSVVDKISLNSISIQNSLSLNENSTTKLVVSFNPSNATNKNVSWKSSNETVVTVDQSGNITAKNAGTAEISVTSSDGGYVAVCKVTVNAIDKSLKSLSLNKDTLTLEVGKEETLSVSFNPTYAINQKVTWKSSDEKIAIVEKGTITALKPGNVEIKVISDESNKEAICKLTVIAPPIESIEFIESEQTVYVGSKTTLKTKTSPEYSAINNPIWESSDETVATVETGVVNALSIGKTVITISNEDGSIKASTIIYVNEKPREPLNIKVIGYELNFDPDKLDYTLKIGSESSLEFEINVDEEDVIIKGNRDLKNGSIITITITDDEKKTYVINIKKSKDYTIYFIGIISVLLLINIFRIISKNKKK